VKFRDSQTDFAELFAAACDDSDPSAPARAAHTLKGTAGNIGARGVQAAAGALEKACVAGAPEGEIASLLAETLAQLRPVLAGLQNVGEPAPAPVAAQTLDLAKAAPLKKKLMQCLQDSDSEASDHAEALLLLAQGTSAAPKVQSIVSALADFDFDAAMNLLQELG